MRKASLDVSPRLAPAQTIWDALKAAETENQKLYRKLAKHLCDCRRMTLIVPLDPAKHLETCKYRTALED